MKNFSVRPPFSDVGGVPPPRDSAAAIFDFSRTMAMRCEGTPPTFEPDIAIIPSGAFWMGESVNDKFATETERPRHRVVFKEPFGLARFPVTVGAYRQFARAQTLNENENWPVVNVSWTEANAYCVWISQMLGGHFRLPSEAEWEYACRAETEGCFSTGETLSIEQANFYYSEQGERIGKGHRTAALEYPPNRYGLFDLAGNVSEFTADAWHPTYLNAPTDGSAWIEAGDATRRVIRGGAWDHLPRLLRCASRDAVPTHERRDNVGFRMALTLR